MIRYEKGDFLHHKFCLEDLVVKEVLSNNRLKVNFAKERDNQVDWEVFMVDCVRVRPLANGRTS